MTEAEFRELLDRCQAGQLSPGAAWETVQARSRRPVSPVAMVDLDRAQRCGYPGSGVWNWGEDG
ncbi:MAG: hypothetical protein U0872_09785 [Planctomycetaceae bacterium]